MGMRELLGRLRRGLGGGPSDPQGATSRFWARAFERGGIRTWMAEDHCRQQINRFVTGSSHEWPMEWFRRVYCVTPFDLGLSLGCGDGPLERDVRRKGVCRAIVGVDLSDGALRIAREKATAESLDAITYQAGDFNALSLPPRHFDIVFFYASLHHVAMLEHCLDQVAAALKPNGLLYLDEYVGPSRSDWSQKLLGPANELYHQVPRRWRVFDRVPLPVREDDPSEAVRSAEIVAAVEARFTIVERYDYGGNLLALLHPVIRWNRLVAAQRDELLDRLLAEEERLLGEGQPSFYTLILARPRTIV